MPTRLANKQYNIRVIFDESGKPILDFVQGFYVVSNNVYDIKGVPDSTMILIAKALGIESSTKVLKGKMKRSNAKISNASQLDLWMLG